MCVCGGGGVGRKIRVKLCVCGGGGGLKDSFVFKGGGKNL